eukprot:31686-Amorphochlora_amoeboformis.AAC.2
MRKYNYLLCGTILLRLRHGHGDREATQLLPRERDRLHHAVVLGKFDVTETFGLVRALVANESDVCDGPHRRKELEEVSLVDLRMDLVHKHCVLVLLALLLFLLRSL